MKTSRASRLYFFKKLLANSFPLWYDSFVVERQHADIAQSVERHDSEGRCFNGSRGFLFNPTIKNEEAEPCLIPFAAQKSGIFPQSWNF